MNHDDVLVLVYAGSYSSSLALRTILEASGIRSSFEDLPSSLRGQGASRIYVTLRDVRRALPLIAEFRTAAQKRESTRG